MSKKILVHAPLLAAALGTAFFSCDRERPHPTEKRRAAETPPPIAANDVVATVNGWPITDLEVKQMLRAASHGGAETSDRDKVILDGLVRLELLRQRAVALGLDSDPEYQKRLYQMEVQLNAFKRRELARLFHEKEILQKAKVGEEEAKKYFDAHSLEIQSTVHVYQILRREESEIEQAHRDLQAGKSFEEVAKARFPNLPPDAKPFWDLGFLKWAQVPGPWRPVVYKLKPGETSGIIRGPKSRFWIVKLVEKQQNTETFATSRSAIEDALKRDKIEELGEKTEKELRAKARIVMRPRASLPSPTPSPPSSSPQPSSSSPTHKLPPPSPPPR